MTSGIGVATLNQSFDVAAIKI